MWQLHGRQLQEHELAIPYILLMYNRPPICSCNFSSLTAQHLVNLTKEIHGLQKYRKEHFHTAMGVIQSTQTNTNMINLNTLCTIILYIQSYVYDECACIR